MPGELTMARQRRGNDCGPSALATVAAHHGLTVGNDGILDAIALDRHGTDLLTISQAAERLGFWTQGIKGTYDVIPEIMLPAIAHVRRRLGAGISWSSIVGLAPMLSSPIQRSEFERYPGGRFVDVGRGTS
jgi:ABC-type bacteriocin/lantibiotic exporter with double-glycine peptidase domain